MFMMAVNTQPLRVDETRFPSGSAVAAAASGAFAASQAVLPRQSGAPESETQQAGCDHDLSADC